MPVWALSIIKLQTMQICCKIKIETSRGVTVRVSCIERFTGKFLMEEIIPILLEWGLWSEQDTCVPLFSRLECTWQRERNFLIIFSWDVPLNICWQTPCSVVTGTSHLKTMKKLDRSLCPVAPFAFEFPMSTWKTANHCQGRDYTRRVCFGRWRHSKTTMPNALIKAFGTVVCEWRHLPKQTRLLV